MAEKEKEDYKELGNFYLQFEVSLEYYPQIQDTYDVELLVVPPCTEMIDKAKNWEILPV